MTPAAPQFGRIERRTLSEEVRLTLEESIRAGTLAPGTQLPSEPELCDQFGVARTSVREAVQGLVTLGLIEKRANRSYVVERLPDVRLDGDPRKRRVHELFEVRQVIEIPIARFAACRATDDERKAIRDLAQRFGPEMELEEFRNLDHRFHSMLAAACGNATLAELHGKVLESLFVSAEFEELLGAPANRAAVREVIRTSAEAHQGIAKAIAGADWAGAINAAEHHLDQVEDHMISKME